MRIFLFVLAGLMMGWGVRGMIDSNEVAHINHISLPEEVSQAAPGDKMGTRIAGDTLVLEFSGDLTVVK